MTEDYYKQKAQALEKKIIEWRRHLHQYPETGMELPKTSRYIAVKLEQMGVEVRENIGSSGVTGIVRGQAADKAEGEKKTIAIRSDMDAINLKEETNLEFASQHEGKMHGCGHDAHMAMALGAAKLLQENRDRFAGNVKLIFQPGEEIAEGAKAMIADGVLEQEPAVDAILGTHIGTLWSLPAGTVGFRSGPFMAAADIIEIKILGEGGHGASPHTTVDALHAGAEVVSSLQNIISRRLDPQEAAVISIGEFNSGSAFNIIAEKAELTGTVRTLSEEVREQLPELIENVLAGVCQEVGADYEYDYIHGAAVLNNDKDMTELTRDTARKLLGEERVTEIERPVMGGEDMAFYQQEVPGTFFALGSLNPDKDADYPHHNPRFNIDEEVLWIGPALFAATAENWLNSC